MLFLDKVSKYSKGNGKDKLVFVSALSRIFKFNFLKEVF